MSPDQTSSIAQEARSGLELFFQNNLWWIVVAALGVLVVLAWLYYADWRKSRSYRHYLECKQRKWARSRKQAKLSHPLPDGLALAVGQRSQRGEDVRTTETAAGEGGFQRGQ